MNYERLTEPKHLSILVEADELDVKTHFADKHYDALLVFKSDFNPIIMLLLKDKVAVVAGAGSGIGRAIALTYAKEGAKVVVADINEEQDGGYTAI